MSIILAAIILTAIPSAAQDLTGRTLTLQECLEMANGGNVTVRNIHLDYLSAKMQKKEALANWFPTVNAAAMGFQSINPLVRVGLDDLLGSSDAANNLKYYLGTEAAMSGINTTYETLSNVYSAGLTLAQPIYAGGRIVNGNRLASLGIEAATLQENIARREVNSEVESKYWKVVSLEEKMKVVDDAVSLADSLLKDTESAFAAGLMTDEGRDRVQLKKQELRALRVRLKGGIMLARMDLCEAIGISSSEAVNLHLEDRIPEYGDPTQYWKDPTGVVAGMDESQLLDLAVRQKKLEKNMAMGEALPQIGVGASYGYGHIIGTPQLNGAVYATVKIPITDWSKTASKMKRLNYQMEKAENDRAHYVDMLELKVRRMWLEVEACWEELQLKQQNVAIAEKAAARSSADLSAGLATASDLMDKQVALSNARCEEVDAQISYRDAITAYFSLYLPNGKNDR